MKTIHINQSDILGGAARAAFRIHQAMLASNVTSSMLVANATSGHSTVAGPTCNMAKGLNLIKPHIGGLLRSLLKTKNPILHSPSILPSFLAKRINRSDTDVVHLHWVCDEMISIRDIGRITKPVVWTLHDMWAFCGAEHYTDDIRWIKGYNRKNRPPYEGGFDLNRWTWNRKRRAWKKKFHIVTPSRWLAECVSKSALMGKWPLSMIPNAVDTQAWYPIDKAVARQLMGLPQNRRLLVFGAMGGGKDPRKGMDLLMAGLKRLRDEISELELVIFGENRPSEVPDVGFPIHYTGHLYDDLSLQVLYSAADVLVIPSRQDNLPNTGVEALACGTPVIAFNTCGLPDIVNHKETGWLAKAFDVEDLAKGIQWVLNDDTRLKALGEKARQFAEHHFAYPVVAHQYIELYKKILEA